MSRAVRNAARYAAGVQLASGPRLVLLLIAAHADHAHEAWPSVPLLAELAGMHEDTVRRAVRRLEATGMVTVQRGGGRRANRYRLALPGTAVGPVDAPDVVHTPRAHAGDNRGVDNVETPRGRGGTPRAGAGAPPAPTRAEEPLKNHGRTARFVPGSGWLTG